MSKAISVRLDDEPERALRLLESTGLSRSEEMWSVDDALGVVFGRD